MTLYSRKDLLTEFDETVLDMFPFIAVIIDSDSRILYVNDIGRKIIGNVSGKLCYKVFSDKKISCKYCPHKKKPDFKRIREFEIKDVLGGRIIKVIQKAIIYGGREAVIELFIDLTDKKRDEETVKFSEELMFDIISKVPVGLCITDDKGFYEYVNPAYCDILGYEDTEELQGKHFTVMIPQGRKNEYKKRYSSFLKKGKKICGECIVERKDGKKITILTAGVKIRTEGGKCKKLTFLIDITERKNAETGFKETSTRLNYLINSINSGILFEDNERKVLFANQAFCNMFDVPSPEAIIASDCSKNMKLSKHLFQDSGYFIDMTNEDLKNRRSSYNEEFYLKDGRVLKRDYIPIRMNKDFLGNLWHYKDISREKRQEKQLSDMLDELKVKTENLDKINKQLLEIQKELRQEKETEEQKVIERTKNLQHANERIQSLLEQKQLFIAQVAHDLKTPLTPVIGLLQVLDVRSSDPQNKKIILDALANARYLNDLLTDILKIAHMDSGKSFLTLEKADLKALIEESIRNHDHIIKSKKIKITKNYKEIPNIKIDKLKIREVIDNILSNAYKYVKSSPRIKITLKTYDHLGNNYVFVGIKDNGVGIRKKSITKIFSEFYKEDQSRHQLSTGLGLSICKKIIEKHDGKIWAQSDGLRKGSSFNFILPIKPLSDEDKKKDDPLLY
ncbi:MAG: PAS domain S-box protein [Candidatus Woesearchaeota archaeon]